MIHEDTIKLLRECDAGIKMGVSAIDDVLDYVKNDSFKNILTKCKEKHEKLATDLEELLKEYGDNGKEPNPLASTMSKIKTNVKLSCDTSDETSADLITDGCNMGVKSLNKYLNKYVAAEEKVKSIAKKLIDLEENLAKDIRRFL